MKKLLAILLFAASLGAFAGGMSIRTPLTNYLVVTNKHFRCTFFPGHMFPVWFETPEGRDIVLQELRKTIMLRGAADWGDGL